MASHLVTLGKAFSILALGVGASGCTGLASFSSVDLAAEPGSPISLAVNDALRNPGPFPKFTDVPSIPKDAPNAEQRLAKTASTQGVGDALVREVAGMPPVDPSAPDAFSAQQRALFDDNIAPDEGERARIEAEAAVLRARAIPPPAPK